MLIWFEDVPPSRYSFRISIKELPGAVYKIWAAILTMMAPLTPKIPSLQNRLNAQLAQTIFLHLYTNYV